MHNSFALTVLGNNIRLVTFKRSELLKSLGIELLQILLSNPSNRFLSLIATSDEVSLAVDEEDFELSLAKRRDMSGFLIHENKWKAIQFTAGSLGFGARPFHNFVFC